MANCLAVHNCLLSYEKASGRLINLEKSSFSFSPNTNEQLAEKIKSVLAIPMVHTHEMYLCLPDVSKRSKKFQFRYLVERVVKQIQGWGNKTFLVGGKESLINRCFSLSLLMLCSVFVFPNRCVKRYSVNVLTFGGE